MKLIPLSARKSSKNKYGVSGVTFNKKSQKWHARYDSKDGLKRKHHHVGFFDALEDAIAAIELARGIVEPRAWAIVSDEDYEYISQFPWTLCVGRCGHRWAQRHVKSESWKDTTRRMHQDIADRMGLVLSGLEIDHIDRDPLNNQRGNIRPATKNQNQWNKGLQKNNTTGFKGVSMEKRTGRFYSYIKVNGVNTRLGTFSTPEEAAAAREAKARELHGEFAAC